MDVILERHEKSAVIVNDGKAVSKKSEAKRSEELFFMTSEPLRINVLKVVRTRGCSKRNGDFTSCSPLHKNIKEALEDFH